MYQFSYMHKIKGKYASFFETHNNDLKTKLKCQQLREITRKVLANEETIYESDKTLQGVQ